MVRFVKQAQAAPAGIAKRLPGRPVGRPVVGADLVQPIGADNSGAVAALVGASRRVVVNGKGNRYQLQTRFAGDDLTPWGGEFLFATKSALLAKFAGDAELSAAVADLPEKPLGVCPEFVALRQSQAAAFALWNNAKDAYPWVVAHVEDWRLVVDPDGETYRLMFSHRDFYPGGSCGWDMWVSSLFSADLDMIRACVGSCAGRRFGENSELWASEPVKLAAALAPLPRFAGELSLSACAARPVSVRGQRLAARPVSGSSPVSRRPARSARA